MVTKEAAMSFSQYGYPYNATSQFFVSANPSTTCCDSLSRSVCDGTGESQTAAAFCCPSYEDRVLASRHTELSAALGMYSSPYAAAAAASHNYANYFPYSTDPSAIYSSLNPQYEIKDGSGSLHSGITQPAAYYPYDHSLSQYPYDRYGTVDFSGSARRKNATRETTSTLKTWLYEHRKNPYPTKGEKIMLAIITKMTLTQVSTWFANARRRLKKENKMTWSPKSKAGDDRKEDLDKTDPDCVSKGTGVFKEDRDLHLSDLDDMEEEDDDCDRLDSDGEKVAPEEQGRQRAPAAGPPLKRDHGAKIGFPAFPCGAESAAAALLPPGFPDPLALKPPPSSSSSSSSSSSLSHFRVSDKPRIWSLAHTAAAGLVPGQHHSAELRTAGVTGDCQLQSAGTAGGQRGGALGGLRGDPSARPPNVHNPFQEGPALHSKTYSAAAGYGHKTLQVHCSSYRTLSDTCQYSAVEGFPSGKAKTEHSDVCAALQDDKAAIFRPVMRR